MRSRDSSLAVWRAASRYRPRRSRGGRTWWTAGCQEVLGGSAGGDARAEVSPVGMGPTPAAAKPTKAIFNTKISVLNSRCGNKCTPLLSLGVLQTEVSVAGACSTPGSGGWPCQVWGGERSDKGVVLGDLAEFGGTAGASEVVEELDVGLVEVLPLLGGVVLVEDLSLIHI